MKVLFKLTALTVDTMSWLYPLILATAASVLTALLIQGIFFSASTFWIVATLPLVYLLWLFWFISLSTIATTAMFASFRKPSSLKINLNFETPQDLRNFVDGARLSSMYRMQSFMHRLPVLNYSLFSSLIFRWMNPLVLRAYSPSVHLGKNSFVMARSEDPDLTFIGQDVVIGAHCQIVCHALNTSHGYFKYSSAPIHIGDNVTIGGNSRLGMGVKVGRGAVVEVSSNVLPFTRIAPYEVWGGNPAQLLRHSEENPVSSATKAHQDVANSSAATAHSPDISELNNIIAKALRIPPELIADDLSSDTCADWDSLAQMAIAASLFDRFGLRLPPADIAKLSSRAAIQQLLDSSHQISSPINPPNGVRNPAVVTPPSPKTSELDNIIAKALRIPPEQIADDLSSDTCADWDSLAQMAIAAALFDRFGLRLAPADIVHLSSRAAIQTLLEERSGGQAIVTPTHRRNEPPAPAGTQQALALPSNPDLLPLGNLADTTRLLAQRFSKPPARTDKPINIAATFTVQPLSSALQLWCRAYQIPVNVDFLGFNQIEDNLLSPTSPFRANTKGLNVVLVRPEDLIDEADPEGRARGQQMLEAIRHYAQQKQDLIVSNLPPATSVFFYGTPAQVLSLRSWWQAQLQAIDNIRILDFASIVENIGRQQARDSSLEVVTRAPYSQLVYQYLGVEIARVVRQTYLPAKKVIALDCDNTLWGGVIGEDGLNGIALGDDYPGRSFKLFQRTLLSLKTQGVLLVLVSKNEAKDVWQVFDLHPDMLLKRDDIAASRINWQAKSGNLRELARELNLGLDAFVFIDDSPTERLEVTTNVPEVTVIPLPTDPTHYVESLTKLWCFDAANVTVEDKQRTQYMQQEQQRQKLQGDGLSLDRYLKALQLEVDIRQAAGTELSRVAQLTQKTNQFNLSLIRRSLSEVKTLPTDYSIWVLSVKDRFGDYGLVGVSIVKPDGDQLLLDTFLMSCRALGRGVETAFMARLFEEAGQAGLTHVAAPFMSGPRNGQVKNFLLEIGFQPTESGVMVASVESSPIFPLHISICTSA